MKGPWGPLPAQHQFSLLLLAVQGVEHTPPAHQIPEKSYNGLATSPEGLRVTVKYLC